MKVLIACLLVYGFNLHWIMYIVVGIIWILSKIIYLIDD